LRISFVVYLVEAPKTKCKSWNQQVHCQ
jgi:hypothetical protein